MKEAEYFLLIDILFAKRNYNDFNGNRYWQVKLNHWSKFWMRLFAFHIILLGKAWIHISPLAIGKYESWWDSLALEEQLFKKENWSQASYQHDMDLLHSRVIDWI